MTTADPLAGFSPHERSSPFLDLIGPVLTRRTDTGIEFALAIDERHVNARGFAHGGVLTTLADVALGFATGISQDPPVHLITTSLAISFAGRVRSGETVVARVDVHRVGRRIAFANCYLTSGDRRVVHASAVFANATPPTDPTR
jgi:acyl-coenzyme A thioesterase 13